MEKKFFNQDGFNPEIEETHELSVEEVERKIEKLEEEFMVKFREDFGKIKDIRIRGIFEEIDSKKFDMVDYRDSKIADVFHMNTERMRYANRGVEGINDMTKEELCEIAIHDEEFRKFFLQAYNDFYAYLNKKNELGRLKMKLEGK